jgi:benzoate 4-monooxygenase
LVWQGWKSMVDVLPWYNYLAFDVIGDLAFGAPFGMLDAAKDIAPVAISTGSSLKTIYIPAVQILIRAENSLHQWESSRREFDH